MAPSSFDDWFRLVGEAVQRKLGRAAKTVADCFKFRHRLGTDVALEALKTGLREKHFTPSRVMEFAKLCRVAQVIRPYLEALR